MLLGLLVLLLDTLQQLAKPDQRDRDESEVVIEWQKLQS